MASAQDQPISTVAGNGAAGSSGDGGPATSARLAGPTDVAVDGAGNLFIADRFNNRIRRVDADTGIITMVAGNGVPKSWTTQTIEPIYARVESRVATESRLPIALTQAITPPVRSPHV